MTEAETDRERIYKAIQAAEPGAGKALLGWVCICEWSDTKGERWLSKISGAPDNRALPAWHERAYLGEGWEDAIVFNPGEEE